VILRRNKTIDYASSTGSSFMALYRIVWVKRFHIQPTCQWLLTIPILCVSDYTARGMVLCTAGWHRMANVIKLSHNWLKGRTWNEIARQGIHLFSVDRVPLRGRRDRRYTFFYWYDSPDGECTKPCHAQYKCRILLYGCSRRERPYGRTLKPPCNLPNVTGRCSALLLAALSELFFIPRITNRCPPIFAVHPWIFEWLNLWIFTPFAA
jgi:hypothetical protein